MEYEIDNLDRSILRALLQDARKPFLEIARELDVSGGTIHQRYNKMRDAGIVQGARAVVDFGKLGYSVSAYVGIILTKAGLSAKTQEHLRAIPEVVELHYTTGTFSLLAKVVAKGIPELYAFLSERLQAVREIQSTETFVILNTSVDREPVPWGPLPRHPAPERSDAS